MVYVILFLMGITLALLENLSVHLFSILIYAVTFWLHIFIECNLTVIAG